MPHASLDQDKALQYWLGQPVPRYTSYPPAPAFGADIGPEAFAASLAKIDGTAGISLYFHIPFCRELCLYCGCNTSITKRDDRIEAYVQALQQEIRMVASLMPRPTRVNAIHWGGGTPNILTEAQLTDLFNLMAAEFDLSACREIAMEMDPRTTDTAQIRALAVLGVNRVSLGVQDFNEAVQKLVHRIQPFSMVEKTCADLRASGIDNINFDLMYGLPLQTPDSVAQTARDVCRLQPQRVALFSYAHVPQMKSHQRALEDAGLPDKYARLNMDQAARDVLTAADYSEIGMDHFARREDDLALALAQRGVHRNFQGYTTDANPVLVALGASAISRLGDGYFQNERVATVYQDMIAAGQPAVVRGLLFSREDRVRAEIIEELMCFMDCDVAEICNRHGYRLSALSASFAALEEMEQIGLIVRDKYKIRLQSPHHMAVRVVCQAFDAYGAGNVSSRAA